ncbi:hypothetical protein F4677DRAFT_406405 [Hypoxylon crocopeplum]|nr:hypothetical protein F4677DRAFT_406405 [Hypoxylon crocopeplum]
MEYSNAYHDLLGAIEYDFTTELSPGVWKVCRKADRIEFLAHDITDKLITDPSNPAEKSETALHTLLNINGIDMLSPMGRILNHPNLIALTGWFHVQRSDAGGKFKTRHYAVWDFCDAGTLGNLLVLEPPPVPVGNELYFDEDTERDIEERVNVDMGLNPDGTEREVSYTTWLPESLCWHVLVSILKALAWLHDGAPAVLPDGHDGWEMNPDPDWEPILHRNITPNNIFLCYPRRDEWYGSCKLGDYSKLYISNHHNGYETDTTAERLLGKALAPPRGTKFKPLKELIGLHEKHGHAYPSQEDQPYTMISEWRALGEIMQAMMVRPVQEDHMAKIREWSVGENLEYTGYSSELKNVVIFLMTFNPEEKMEDGEFSFGDRECLTSAFCAQAYSSFREWKLSGDPEGEKMVIEESQFAQQLAGDDLEEMLATLSAKTKNQILKDLDDRFGENAMKKPEPPTIVEGDI